MSQYIRWICVMRRVQVGTATTDMAKFCRCGAPVSSDEGPVLRICLCFLIIACSSKKTAVYPGVIIGKNDIMPLSEVRSNQIAQEVLQTAVKASALVVTVLLDKDSSKSNFIFCSGALIPAAKGKKEPRIVTNYHCVSEHTEDGKMLDKLLPRSLYTDFGLLQFFCRRRDFAAEMSAGLVT